MFGVKDLERQLDTVRMLLFRAQSDIRLLTDYLGVEINNIPGTPDRVAVEPKGSNARRISESGPPAHTTTSNLGGQWMRVTYTYNDQPEPGPTACKGKRSSKRKR